MIIAEISVVPLGTSSPSVSKYVALVEKKLKQIGLKPMLNPMGTVFETSDISKVFEAVSAARESVFEAGAERLVLSLKLDERRDKEGNVGQKIASVEEKL